MVASARWDALGTWCEVHTVEDEDLPALADLARTRVAALERVCGTSPGGSELDALSTGRPHRVSPLLALVVAAALRVAEVTGGLVDPTGSPVSGQRESGNHRSGAGGQPVPPPAWRRVALDPERGTVVVPDGVRLDVHTHARAWAADWIAAACEEEVGAGCLVNLGGDIAVQGRLPDGGWQIEIDDGHAGPQGRPVISMEWPGGLATSSSLRNDRDPGTALAATPAVRYWRTVTVAGRSCERAHAGAAAALVLADAAPRWLSQRELPARLVHTGGVVVQTNGWPRQRWIT